MLSAIETRRHEYGDGNRSLSINLGHDGGCFLLTMYFAKRLTSKVVGIVDRVVKQIDMAVL